MKTVFKLGNLSIQVCGIFFDLKEVCSGKRQRLPIEPKHGIIYRVAVRVPQCDRFDLIAFPPPTLQPAVDVRRASLPTERRGLPECPGR